MARYHVISFYDATESGIRKHYLDEYRQVLRIPLPFIERFHRKEHDYTMDILYSLLEGSS